MFERVNTALTAMERQRQIRKAPTDERSKAVATPGGHPASREDLGLVHYLATLLRWRSVEQWQQPQPSHAAVSDDFCAVRAQAP
jgi:hypothetical protein